MTDRLGWLCSPQAVLHSQRSPGHDNPVSTVRSLRSTVKTRSSASEHTTSKLRAFTLHIRTYGLFVCSTKSFSSTAARLYMWRASAKDDAVLAFLASCRFRFFQSFSLLTFVLRHTLCNKSSPRQVSYYFSDIEPLWSYSIAIGVIRVSCAYSSAYFSRNIFSITHIMHRVERKWTCFNTSLIPIHTPTSHRSAPRCW